MDEPNKNTPAATTTTSVDADFLYKLPIDRLSQQEALASASSGPRVDCLYCAGSAAASCFNQSTNWSAYAPSAIPPFANPNSKSSNQSKRKKNRGGRPGHPGKTRDTLPSPDLTQNQQLDHCTEWQGKLAITGETRSRHSEDIPEELKPLLTEDIIHHDYCPRY